MDTTDEPNFNLQDEELDLWNMPLLGLKLRKSLLHKRLAAMDMTEKVTQKPAMASNFPFTSISIGSWRRVSSRKGDLTAKLYFVKRKVIWEFVDGELKSKIEVGWDDITGINAYMPPNQPGTLQIELGRTPSFFREINPQPLKHTNWEPISDFTAAHASHHRIHTVTFPQGVLDEHYSKLLQYDKNLFELSQMPFPTQGESPYFNVQTAESPFLNPIMTAAGMANHHEASSSGHEDGGPLILSTQFNQTQNNPNLYGHGNNDDDIAAAPINRLQHLTLEGSNNMTVEQPPAPELISYNNGVNMPELMNYDNGVDNQHLPFNQYY